MKLEYNYLVIVVIYNKQISDSKTLLSLINNINTLPNNLKLVVWNNGPNDIVWSDSPIDVDIINCNTNEPLSFIYNKLINNYKSNIYCIFDDDTEIIESYFSCFNILNNKKPWILIPDIIYSGKKIYPKSFYNREYSNRSKSELIVSVMSGIAFNMRLVDSNIDCYGFLMDESFSFYGIDTSFLLNVQTADYDIDIIRDGYLIHDLSSLTEVTLSNFRFRERCYDQVLMFLHYRSFYTRIFMIKELSKLIIKGFFRFDIILFINLFKIIMYKKHPRC